MYESTVGIMLTRNMYHGVDRKGAEFIGNKQTNVHTDTQVYILYLRSFCMLFVLLSDIDLNYVTVSKLYSELIRN